MQLPRLLLLLILITLPLHAEETLKIGVSAAFTGSSSGLGNQYLKGANLVFNEQNKHGGIKGKPIKLIAYDDAYTPEKTLQNTLKLIKKDKVSLLYGYVGTPTTLAILPLLLSEKNQGRYIPLFFPFTGASTLRKDPFEEVVYNFRANYQQETETIVDYLVKNGKTRIAIFYQIDTYGRDGWSGVRAALKKRNLNIVAEASYKRGDKFTQSFKTQVNALKSQHADAVIIIGSYQASAGFIRDARNENWNVPIANISFVGLEKLLEILNTLSQKEHKEYTKNLLNTEVVYSIQDNNIQEVQEYKNLKNKEETASFIEFEGYLSAKLLIEILKIAKEPYTQDNLNMAIKTLKKENIVGNQWSHHVELLKIENGHYVSI